MALLNISTILGHNVCPSSQCGNVSVHYPFNLEHETPSASIKCTYFNLICNKTSGTTIFHLPPAGHFYVQKINYTQQYIQLYDPRNCLTKRLFDLSLPVPSPFKTNYENYTLYVCPPDLAMGSILCLSNSTNITVVASGSFKDDNKCEPTHYRLLPVHEDNAFSLTWDSNGCANCDDHDSGGWGAKIIGKIVTVALTLPGLIIMSLSCCSLFCFHLLRLMRGRNVVEAEAAEVHLPSSTTGLDESKIVGCTELVIVSEGEQGCKSKMCSICLEAYSEKEKWLGKNATCPVCRTSLL
ncbi:RING-H2 finger protein ATL22-like [Salvia splendens]|uniref:RING-H2 finger protein ATL22-like n=1 Tax=Salvia splendens TaxID=180675 RepID=UPI001C253A6C|nr:RING-H2 finger protein ATL22-like [Salvia splendens]